MKPGDHIPGAGPDISRAYDKVPCLILDGTIIARDRPSETIISVKGKQIDSWYNGKAHAYGGNVQALMDPRGVPRWLPDVLPGRLNDLDVARQSVLAIVWAYTKDTPVPADDGYNGAGRGVLAPVPQRADDIPPHADQHTYNKLLRGLRCLGENGFALLIEPGKPYAT